MNLIVIGVTGFVGGSPLIKLRKRFPNPIFRHYEKCLLKNRNEA